MEISVPSLKRTSEFTLIARQALSSEAFQTLVSPRLSEHYHAFASLLARFPQYYRIILPMLVFIRGDESNKLIEIVLRAGVHLAEFSDIRKLDAENLLQTIRPGWAFPDRSLHERTIAASANPHPYLYPNRDLGYHLTHAVFYLTSFGARQLPAGDAHNIHANLLTVGALAYLDDDTDLLAEVCVCCFYLGRAAPACWLDLVQESLRAFAFLDASAAGDDYHEYLCACWALTLAARMSWEQCIIPQTADPGFHCSRPRMSGLAEIQRVCLHISQLDVVNRPGLAKRLADEFRPRFGLRLSQLELSPHVRELVPILSHGLLTAEDLSG